MAVKQLLAHAYATQALVDGTTKFGRLAIGAVAQMRHGYQIQIFVVVTVQFVTVELQAVDIALDMAITSQQAKTQVAVAFVQRQQVLQYLVAMVFGHLAQRHLGAGTQRFTRRLRQYGFKVGNGSRHGSFLDWQLAPCGPCCTVETVARVGNRTNTSIGLSLVAIHETDIKPHAM